MLPPCIRKVHRRRIIVTLKPSVETMTNSRAPARDLDDLTSFGVYHSHGGDDGSSFCTGASHTKLDNHQDHEENTPASMQSVSFRVDELSELSFNCKKSPQLQSAVFTHSKRNTLLVLLAFVSCIQCAMSKAVDTQFCDTFGPEISAYCPTFSPTGDCCTVISTVMDMEPSSPCLCPVLNFTSLKDLGLTLDVMMKLYYDCNGRQQRYHFSRDCEGINNTSSVAPTSAVKWTPQDLPDENPTTSAEQWATRTVVAIVLLSLLVIFLLLWLMKELCFKVILSLQDIEFGDPPGEEAPQQDQEQEEDYPLLQNPQQGQEEQSASSAARSIFAASSSSGLEEQSASSAVSSTSAKPTAENLAQANAQMQKNPQQGLEEQSTSSAVRSSSARPTSENLAQADAQVQKNPQQGLEDQSTSSATRSSHAAISQLAKSALAVVPQMPQRPTDLKIVPSFGSKRKLKMAFDLPLPAVTTTMRKLTSTDDASSSAAEIQKNRQLVVYNSDFAYNQIAALSLGTHNEEATDSFICPMEIEENAASQVQTTGEIFPSAVGVDAVPSASTPERTRCTRSYKPDGYMHERMEDSRRPRKAAPKASIKKKKQTC